MRSLIGITVFLFFTVLLVYPVSAQKLRLNGSYNIKNEKSGRCMQLRVPEGDSGTGVELYDCADNNDKKEFHLVYDNGIGGYELKLTGRFGGECLDVANADKGLSVSIHKYKCNGESNQRWKLVPNGSFYEIRPMHVGNRCIDVSNGSTGNNADIRQYECNGQNNQRWSLELVGKPDIEGNEPLLVSPSKGCTALPDQPFYKQCELKVLNQSDYAMISGFKWDIPSTTFTPAVTIQFKEREIRSKEVLNLYYTVVIKNSASLQDYFSMVNPQFK